MFKKSEAFRYEGDILRDNMGRFSRNGHHGENHQLSRSFPVFSRASNPSITTALHILDNGSFNDLYFSQKKYLLVYYAWHHQGKDRIKYRSLVIPGTLEYQSIDTVGDNLEERYERLHGMIGMVRRVEGRGFKAPSISEFDYWVYQRWLEGKELVKNLADNIPKEFDQSDLSRRLRMSKISQSIQKLKKYGEISHGFNKRRQDLRRTRISEIQREGGEVSAGELQEGFEVNVSTLRDDLQTLRRKGRVGPGRNMDPKEKQDLMKRIVGYVRDCESGGRNYAKGGIGPAEIADALGMDRIFINNFIKKNSNRMNLPKRQDPNAGRPQEKRKVKETVKDLDKQGTIPTCDLVRLLLQSYPHLKKGTLKKYALEAKREQRGEISSLTDIKA